MKKISEDTQLSAKVRHLVGLWEYTREQGLQAEQFKILARRAKEVALTLQSKNAGNITNDAVALVKALHQSYKIPLTENNPTYIKIDHYIHNLEKVISCDATVIHPSVRSKGKILSLLDNINNKKISLHLKEYGFEVIQASSKEESKNNLVRAILIDKEYCDNNTFEEFTKQPWQTEKIFSTPIIYLGNKNQFEERLQAAQYKALGFLNFPIDPHKLIEQIERLSLFVDEPYRVLMCDSPTKDNTKLMQYFKQSGFISKTITSPLLVNRALVEYNPDLVFINIKQADTNGFAVARIVRQQENYMNLPIIILTEKFDYVEQFQSLKIGCPYVLSSPIDKAGVLAISIAWSQRSRILKSQLAKDSLTGLLNHSRTLEQLDIELVRQARYNAPLSFAMLDIDDFKKVNDTYGHGTGDLVIKTLAQLLKMRLRKTDIVGRYGGEEFAVILPNTDQQTALKILNDILTGFAEIKHIAGKKSFQLTFSGGVAATDMFKKPNVTQLTEAADGALYKAKAAGKNKILLLEAN